MRQGRLQIRSSLVAFASLDSSFAYADVTGPIASRPTAAAAVQAIVLDLEREVLADELGRTRRDMLRLFNLSIYLQHIAIGVPEEQRAVPKGLIRRSRQDVDAAFGENR
jgi:hypothetical protein